MSGDPQDAAPSESVDALTDASPTSASAGGAAVALSYDPRVTVDTEAARERILEAMTGDAVYSSDGAARELDAFVAARLEAAETVIEAARAWEEYRPDTPRPADEVKQEFHAALAAYDALVAARKSSQRLTGVVTHD